MIDIYGQEGAVIETLQGLLADSARFYDLQPRADN